MNPHNKFLFKTTFFEYFEYAIMYFQVGPIIEASNILILIFYIVVVVQSIIFGLFLVSVYYIGQPNRGGSLVVYFLKLISIFAIFIVTIFVIPFIHTLFIVAYCNEQSVYDSGITCYSGLYFVHFAIALISIIIFGLLIAFFQNYFGDLNPNSTLPFACPQTKATILKLFIKILLPIYITLDYKFQLTKEFMIILLILYFVLLIIRYRSLPYFNKSVHLFVILSELILFWATFVVVIEAYLDFGEVDDLGFFYFIIFLPFICYMMRNQLNQKKLNIMNLTMRQMKKDTDFEFYIYTFIDLIENREDIDKRIILEGVLNLHIRQCNKSQSVCCCRTLIIEGSKEDEIQVRHKKWYTLVKSILQDGLERFPKCARLHLVTAFLLHEKMKNKFKAIYELMITEESKPNLMEEFQMFRFKNIIEDEMIETDQRNIDQKAGVDVNQIVTFQNNFVLFQSSVESSVNLHLEFWRELLEDNPDIQKLQQLGSKITISLDTTQELFKKLMQINSNEIKCLLIYGNFLIDIVNDEPEGQRLIEKADYIQKSAQVNKFLIDDDKRKYGENSNTCILTCSGNYNSVGLVQNSNNEITRILGFSKNDVIGQKITRIMPKVYADMHDGFMKNFLDTSESKILGIERLVMAQNKDGYIVPCSLMIKVLPNLSDGIQIVGFLKEIEENNQSNSNFMAQGRLAIGSVKKDEDIQKFSEQKMLFIMYNPVNNLVLGITYNCFECFGIPASLVYGNSSNTQEFLLDSILPEIIDHTNTDRLKQTGMMCQIDTTTLKQEFLIGQNESDDEMDDKLENNYYDFEENGKKINANNSVIDSSNVELLNSSAINNSQILAKANQQRRKKIRTDRYRRSRVKAMIVDDQEFQDYKIYTLQFMETNEEDQDPDGVIGQFKKTYAVGETMNQTKMPNEKVKNNNDDEEEHDGEGEPGNVQQSERDSQGSGISLNEDVRLLKDFKQLMSEKTETKNIKILKRTVVLVGLALITLTAIEFVYKGNQNIDVSVGQTAIYNSFFRRKVMSDIIFYTRMLNLLAVGQYVPKLGNSVADYELQMKQNLSTYVDQLQSIQFDLIKSKITMQSKTSNSIVNKEYPVVFLLQTGENKTYQNIYDDALFQFLTSASAIRNASLSSFNQTDTIESTQKNLFYIIQNGLFVLRKGSEEIAAGFYDFYCGLIKDYMTNFTVILSLAIVFLVLSQVVLIPIVFQVHAINNKVLSLFGLIQQTKVKELAEKCEKYKLSFLEDAKKEQQEQIDQAKEQKPNENKKEINEEEEDQDDDKIKNQYLEVNNEDDALKRKGINKPPTTPTIAKQQQQEQDKKEEEDADNIRSLKLLNSKTTNRALLILKFGFVTGMLIGYFVASYMLEQTFQDDISKIYSHLRVISNRPSVVKLNVYTMFEEIVHGYPLIENGQSLRQMFFDQVYSNEREIFQSLKNPLPGVFSGYLNLFNSFDYESICDQTFSYNQFTMNQGECNQINSGLLTKGLSTTIVSVAMSTEEMINQYQSGNDSFGDVKAIFNSDKFEVFSQLLKYIDPSECYLVQVFMKDIDTYLSDQGQIEKIKFSLFVLFLTLIFLFIWLPYNNGLSLQIWRIKGMLNMIPMDIIQNQENLKVAFLQGDIIQAVK